jgi:hypothetical protein
MCELNKLFDDVLEDWVIYKESSLEKNFKDVVEPTYLECSKKIKSLKRKKSKKEDYPEFKKYIKVKK